MKTNPEHNRDETLLDAVLRDDSWAQLNADMKQAALAEFHAYQRRRRIFFGTLQVAACAAITVGVVWMSHHAMTSEQSNAHASVKAFKPAPSTIAQNSATRAPSGGAIASTAGVPAKLPQYITEEQMLALFPKGSCIIAKINGQEQLVFFDHKIEEEGAPYKPGS